MKGHAKNRRLIGRRSFPRLKIWFNGTYAKLKGAKKRPAVIDNISAGGARLWVNESLKTGTELILNFHLPHRGKTISIKSKVKRSSKIKAAKGYRAGIHFAEVEKEVKKLIIQLFHVLPEA